MKYGKKGEKGGEGERGWEKKNEVKGGLNVRNRGKEREAGRKGGGW